MRVPELKALARDRGLRNYSWMRKAELVALLRKAGTKALENNDPPPGQSRASASPTPHTRPPPPPPQRRAAYVTLKFDYNGCCRIHGVSDGDGRDPLAHKEIVTNKTYVVMPWKMVTRNGKNMTLKEMVEEIEAHEEERRLVSEFEAEHSDEIDEIFGLIENLHIENIRARFPEICES